jgi:hypothetical protein
MAMANGTVTSFDPNTNDVVSMVAGVSDLYWVALYAPPTGGLVNSFTFGGVNTTEVGGGNYTSAVTISGSTLYWSDEGTQANGYLDGDIQYLPTTGGSGGTLITGLASPTGLASDSASLYWIACNGSTGTGSVQKMGLGGGMVTTLTSVGCGPQLLALDSAYVYLVDTQIHIAKVSVGGGSLTTVATDSGNIGWLAVDSTSVYWSGTSGLKRLTPK